MGGGHSGLYDRIKQLEDQWNFHKEEENEKSKKKKINQESAEGEFNSRFESYSKLFTDSYLYSLGDKIKNYIESRFDKYDIQDIIEGIKQISFQEKTIETFDDIIKEEALKSVELSSPIKHFNVVVCGKTGVGKSTLINEILHLDKNKQSSTGSGKPVTKGAPKVYKSDTLQTLRIYDTQGIELQNHDVKTTIQELSNLIEEKAKEKNPDWFIHAIWYCIGVPGSRIEDPEKEAIRQLQEIYPDGKLPIIIVLTQAFDIEEVEELTKIIKEEVTNNITIIPVLAKTRYNFASFGFPELLKTTYNQSMQSSNSAFNHSLHLEVTKKIKDTKINNQEKLDSETKAKVEDIIKNYSLVLTNDKKQEIVYYIFDHIISKKFYLKQNITTATKRYINNIISSYFILINEIGKQFLIEQIEEQSGLMTQNYIYLKSDIEFKYDLLLSHKNTREQISSMHQSTISNLLSEQIIISFKKEGFNKIIESFIGLVMNEASGVFEECLKNMNIILQKITNETMAKRVDELRELTLNSNEDPGKIPEEIVQRTPN